ncbi:MAG TPA: hypothetical protein VKY59_16525 [Spirillospora sp.]|nr:hypothetical protein [Spirillospora sp.]
MHIISERTTIEMTRHHINELHRSAEQRRLVRIARGARQPNVLLRIVKRLLANRPRFRPDALSEEALHQAGVPGVSLNEAQEQEQIRRLHERIVRSNQKIKGAHESWA